jgi:hypothetical protein
MMKLAPTPQKSNARGKGRGDAPPHPAPQKVILGKRRGRHYSPSSSSSSSSSSRSSSSSSGRHSCSRKHKRRHRRKRRHSPPNYYPGSISCAPSLPKSLRHRIRRGKFVVIDYSLKAYHLLQTVKQSGISARLPTYLPGVRHGIDTC